MPSFNDTTGARISSGVHVKGTDKDKFAQGWDLLWGNKTEEVLEEASSFKPCDECPPDRCCKSPYCKNLSKFQE